MITPIEDTFEHAGLVEDNVGVDIFIPAFDVVTEWHAGPGMALPSDYADSLAKELTEEWFVEHGLDHDYHFYGSNIMADPEDGDIKVSYYFRPDQKDMAMLFKLIYG